MTFMIQKVSASSSYLYSFKQAHDSWNKNIKKEEKSRTFHFENRSVLKKIYIFMDYSTEYALNSCNICAQIQIRRKKQSYNSLVVIHHSFHSFHV